MLVDFDIDDQTKAMRSMLQKAVKENPDLMTPEDVEMTLRTFQATSTFVKTLLLEKNASLRLVFLNMAPISHLGACYDKGDKATKGASDKKFLKVFNEQIDHADLRLVEPPESKLRPRIPS